MFGSFCQNGSCSLFRYLSPGRNRGQSSQNICPTPPPLPERETTVYPSDSLRAALEQTKDSETFLKTLLNFEKNDQIRNILRLEKLLDHNLFIDRMAVVPDEVIRNNKLVPRKYDQDSLLYLKLKAELAVKTAEARRLSTGEPIISILKNYDYVHALEIMQETFSLFRKTLELFSYPFLDFNKDTQEKIIGKRIQVCKWLFFLALRHFIKFICRFDFVKEDKHLEEVDASVGQFFQTVDRFLITMGNMKVQDEEITAIEGLHKTNLKPLVSMAKEYCAVAAKGQTAKALKTLDLIKIRLQQASANRELKVSRLEEEVAALAGRLDEYKKQGLLNTGEVKKLKKAKALHQGKDILNEKDLGLDDLSEDLDESDQNRGKLSTIKEISSNYDDYSSRMDAKRQNSFTNNRPEDLASKIQQKHVTRTSFTLPKKSNYD